MTTSDIVTLSIGLMLTLTNIQAQEDISKRAHKKIQFEYTVIDDKGYLNGETIIDYEFCIPKDEKKVAGIMAIDSTIAMPRRAKGRIGCSEDEWLCIVSNHSAGWKERLFAIASLPYVKRIIQTHYE